MCLSLWFSVALPSEQRPFGSGGGAKVNPFEAIFIPPFLRNNFIAAPPARLPWEEGRKEEQEERDASSLSLYRSASSVRTTVRPSVVSTGIG